MTSGQGCGCPKCKELLPEVAHQTPAEALAKNRAWAEGRLRYRTENPLVVTGEPIAEEGLL